MNIDLSDKKNASLAKLSFAIAKRLYGFAMRLLASLRLMVLQTFFNILLITGIIMMFVQIIYWLQITFNEFRMTFDFFESFWFVSFPFISGKQRTREYLRKHAIFVESIQAVQHHDILHLV